MTEQGRILLVKSRKCQSTSPPVFLKGCGYEGYKMSEYTWSYIISYVNGMAFRVAHHIKMMSLVKITSDWVGGNYYMDFSPLAPPHST